MYACARCGAEFTGHKRRYCSLACREPYRLANRPDTFTCLGCGEQTDTPRLGPVPKYCTTYCRSRHWQEQNRERYNARARAGAARKRSDRPAVLLNCPQCKYEFMQTRAGMKFCSPSCTTAASDARCRADGRKSAWKKANPDKVRAWNAVTRHSRRAQEASSGGDGHTAGELRWHLDSFRPGCFYCGTDFTSSNPMHLDHIRPISKGGPDSLTNMVPSCKRCNLAKNDKTLSEFAYRVIEESGRIPV